jgi:hypothetical protein
VANITLQLVCPHNTATHLSMPEDPDALNQVRHALDRDATPPAACA